MSVHHGQPGLHGGPAAAPPLPSEGRPSVPHHRPRPTSSSTLPVADRLSKVASDIYFKTIHSKRGDGCCLTIVTRMAQRVPSATPARRRPLTHRPQLHVSSTTTTHTHKTSCRRLIKLCCERHAPKMSSDHTQEFHTT